MRGAYLFPGGAMDEDHTTVEATHVRQTIFRSDLHFAHGMQDEIDRLVFVLSDDEVLGPFLVMYFWEGQFGAYILDDGKQLAKMRFRNVKKVQVPRSMFNVAYTLASIQQGAKRNKLEEKFAKLTDDKT
jgi:hypothetical protein